MHPLRWIRHNIVIVVYGPTRLHFPVYSYFDNVITQFLYLIVPFWYASAACQASLVEPWRWRPNEPDMPPKRLGIYRTQIRPSDPDIVAISGQWLDIAGCQDSRHYFWLADCEFGYGKSSNRGQTHNKLAWVYWIEVRRLLRAFFQGVFEEELPRCSVFILSI